MAYATCMLGMFAQTSVHAGTGQELGVIDLPIQRESHTGYPCIFGSGIKGAMRAKAEQGTKEWVADVFGPESARASEHAGALQVADARLLLLPVRSLTSHFKWVTCPAILQRYQTDRERLGLPAVVLPPSPKDDAAFLPSGAAGSNQYLYLEELQCTVVEQEMTELITALADLLPPGDGKDRLPAQLAIVSDDLFAFLSRHATPVTPHVAIDNTNKTVRRGALWYEETLPAETLLYVSLFAQASRRRESTLDAAGILGCVTGDLLGEGDPWLQVGGNETVGMGWCRVQGLMAEGK